MGIADFVITKNFFAWFLVLFFLIILTIINYNWMRKLGMVKKMSPKQFNIFQKKQKVKEIKVKAEKIIKKPKAEKKVKEPDNYNISKSKSKLSVDFWKDWYLEKYHPAKIVLVNMELSNGFHRTFKIKEKDDGFQYKGKKYLFDDENKYYNIDSKLYTFDFHENLVLPVRRKIPVTDIRKTIESSEMVDIEYAINPSTLQRFMTAKIAEGVMRGSQLDEFMKKLQMFLIVTMVAVLVHLALFIGASGMLKNLSLGGLI